MRNISRNEGFPQLSSVVRQRRRIDLEIFELLRIDDRLEDGSEKFILYLAHVFEAGNISNHGCLSHGQERDGRHASIEQLPRRINFGR